MEQSRRMVAGVLLCLLALGLCPAQHWSYGLQPGGKRSAQVLLGPFQEIPNEMEKLEEMQQSECPGSQQNSRIRDLKEAMERLVEGEGRRKKV
ncbi:progonadoliberin-1 [Onychostruthus taczanowskii]|uniref:progonadoliberin-1 n=1 Tax=Onychostruthus taczanowskii TaxID=356909 RepID=UPI001B80309B|nr:progonadoliberin-1 [Onychostruthus taczanowskii]